MIFKIFQGSGGQRLLNYIFQSSEELAHHPLADLARPHGPQLEAANEEVFQLAEAEADLGERDK